VAVVGDGAHLDAGHRRPGGGVEHLERRVEVAVGGDGEFGEAPGVGDPAHAEHLTRPPADLRGRGCAAAGQHAEAGEERVFAVALLGVEVGEEERHRAAEHGDAVRGHALW
jgi:hypothetical protein